MRLPPNAGPVKGRIEVHHLDVAALGRNAKMFRFLESVAMMADFSSDFAISGTHLLEAGFTLDGSARPRWSACGRRCGCRRCTSPAITTAPLRAFRWPDATLVSDRLRAHVVGGVDFVYDPSGAIARLGVDLAADKTALAIPGMFAQPVFVPLAQLKGQLCAGDPRHPARTG